MLSISRFLPKTRLWPLRRSTAFANKLVARFESSSSKDDVKAEVPYSTLQVYKSNRAWIYDYCTNTINLNTILHLEHPVKDIFAKISSVPVGISECHKKGRRYIPLKVPFLESRFEINEMSHRKYLYSFSGQVQIIGMRGNVWAIVLWSADQ